MNIQPKPQKIRVRPLCRRDRDDAFAWCAEWPSDGSKSAGAAYAADTPAAAVRELCRMLQEAAEREARR